MNPITIPNITIPTIGLPAIGIPSVGFPSASGGGLVWPAGMKEHIKAIYDPAKQGMTNYDVIESYAEDFTTWNNRTDKYTGTLTSNKLTVIGVSKATALIYVGRKPENFSIYISGLKENQQVIAGNDIGQYRAVIAEKDGLYHINWKENESSYCIFTNFTGACNITITQLPTSVLKDLSGNGNHAYLYGGKGKLNSGIGVYSQDFTSYTTKNGVINSFTSVLTNDNKSLLLAYIRMTKDIEPYNINVKGIVNETVSFFYRNEEGAEKQFVITKDGDYTVPKCYMNGTSGVSTGYTANNRNENTKITITQIPDYPNQLCYDGKMYAVCYGFPILEDYAVMADRTWFIEQLSNWTGVLSSNAYSGYTEERGFIFEYNAGNNKVQNNSFGTNNLNTRHQDGISYMTKTSYNGNSINSGDLKGVDFLTIGAFVDKDTLKGSYNWKGCHGKIIIADRSFTEDEITWLKDNWKKI